MSGSNKRFHRVETGGTEAVDPGRARVRLVLEVKLHGFRRNHLGPEREPGSDARVVR